MVDIWKEMFHVPVWKRSFVQSDNAKYHVSDLFTVFVSGDKCSCYRSLMGDDSSKIIRHRSQGHLCVYETNCFSEK